MPTPVADTSPNGTSLNAFPYGRNPAAAPRRLGVTWAYPVITEPNLVALLGACPAIQNTSATVPWPYYGGDLPDRRAIQRVFARVYLQTDTPDNFGAPKLYVYRLDGSKQTVMLSLEQKFSPNAACYSTSALLTANASDWRWWAVGSDVAAGIVVLATGAQFSSDNLGHWIRPGDYPTEEDPRLRLRVAETALAADDPPIDILYGPDMWLIEGRDQAIYPDNIMPVRTAAKKATVTLRSLKASAGNLPFAESSSGAAIRVTPSRIGPATAIVARRWSDTTAPGLTGYRYRLPVTAHVAPATGLGDVSLACIGDSLTSMWPPAYAVDKLNALGFTATGIGTIANNGTNAEGRGGCKFADVINKTGGLDPVYIGAEPTYMAGDVAYKSARNPFVRPAIPGDPADCVFNGQVFDYGFYLLRFSLPTPKYVHICFGTNDIIYDTASFLANIQDGLRVVVASVLAADPGVKVGLGFPTLARSGSADSQWTAFYPQAIRAYLAFAKTLASPRVKILPLWAHITQEADYSMAVATTDPVTGMESGNVSDTIHFQETGRHQWAEVMAAWVACEEAGA